LGALIAGGVLVEITDVCPGPGGGDHDATNVSPTQRRALPSTAILLLSHANAPNMLPEALGPWLSGLALQFVVATDRRLTGERSAAAARWVGRRRLAMSAEATSRPSQPRRTRVRLMDWAICSKTHAKACFRPPFSCFFPPSGLRQPLPVDRLAPVVDAD
jgi:hypothetical protein